MSDAALLRRNHELEAQLLEEALQAMRDGHFIADADVDRWLADWKDGKDVEVPGRPSGMPSAR